MNVVRWGMIGCGSVAERKSGPAFYKAPGSALVAVMGRRLEAVSDYAARHGIARVYTDVDALINDPEVDYMSRAYATARSAYFVVEEGGKAWLTILGDAGYPVTGEVLESAARG